MTQRVHYRNRFYNKLTVKASQDTLT